MRIRLENGRASGSLMKALGKCQRVPAWQLGRRQHLSKRKITFLNLGHFIPHGLGRKPSFSGAFCSRGPSPRTLWDGNAAGCHKDKTAVGWSSITDHNTSHRVDEPQDGSPPCRSRRVRGRGGSAGGASRAGHDEPAATRQLQPGPNGDDGRPPWVPPFEIHACEAMTTRRLIVLKGGGPTCHQAGHRAAAEVKGRAELASWRTSMARTDPLT
jgi:hypothetical protein